MSVRTSLLHRARSAGKDSRRRSARLEVFPLEDRALLSGILAPAAAHGLFATAASGVAESRSGTDLASRRAVPATPPALTPVERLGYYDPNLNGGEFEQLGVALKSDPNLLRGKDVYVLVHGWAPGYRAWVDNYARATHQVLEWWQTIRSNYPDNAAGEKAYMKVKQFDTGGVGPESPWLLDGHVGENPMHPIPVSANGLTQDLIATDSNAVVLAFSWLDDSATSAATDSYGIPTQAYRSEAMTALDGERLADALEQVLGSEAQFNGKLQLIGHSHGTKVATVAAVALTHAASPIMVNQLTILDSPESTFFFGALTALGAANDNWYFLNDLNISKTPSSTSTFVENYISALDEPYSGITFTKGNVPSNPDLSQIVDVQLHPWPDVTVNDPAAIHTYAAYWYAGSAEGPGTTYKYTKTDGRWWSPLVPGSRGSSNLASYYVQSWSSDTVDPTLQYQLTSGTAPALTPVFSPVTLTPTMSSPGVAVSSDPVNGDSVTLTSKNGAAQSFEANFPIANDPLLGLTFQYQFSHTQPGDNATLTIADGMRKQDARIGFVMEDSASQHGLGTISIAGVRPNRPYLRFTLTSSSGAGAPSVTVSNLMQYTIPLTSTRPGSRRGSTK
jgi:hypothetical protein